MTNVWRDIRYMYYLQSQFLYNGIINQNKVLLHQAYVILAYFEA
jgi:hypothetical protein